MLYGMGMCYTYLIDILQDKLGFAKVKHTHTRNLATYTTLTHIQAQVRHESYLTTLKPYYHLYLIL